jgi:hypothetical protein
MALAVALLLAACAGATPSPATGSVTVDIVFLNHPPVREVLTQVDAVLAAYGDKVSVARYDFDTPEGATFAQQKGLSGHIPLVIFVNGSQSFDVNGHQVTFESFPQGEGTGVVPDGAWTIADLDSVLKTVVEK